MYKYIYITSDNNGYIHFNMIMYSVIKCHYIDTIYSNFKSYKVKKYFIIFYTLYYI
jgi:hypothetical protein